MEQVYLKASQRVKTGQREIRLAVLHKLNLANVIIIDKTDLALSRYSLIDSDIPFIVQPNNQTRCTSHTKSINIPTVKPTKTTKRVQLPHQP
jgi:hypothetical protein